MRYFKGYLSVVCALAMPVVIAGAASFWTNSMKMLSIPMGPLHASCNVDWAINGKCDGIRDSILQQMKKWESAENCKSGGEKCLYKVQSQTATEIKGTHETPVKHYIDDLTFKFAQDGDVCKVNGYSRSETWYAVLDYGTNYCNLHNLIVGAGIDKLSGYSENTSDSQCTQFSSADCEKY